jgi:hypothetical protein
MKVGLFPSVSEQVLRFENFATSTMRLDYDMSEEELKPIRFLLTNEYRSYVMCRKPSTLSCVSVRFSNRLSTMLPARPIGRTAHKLEFIMFPDHRVDSDIRPPSVIHDIVFGKDIEPVG